MQKEKRKKHSFDAIEILIFPFKLSCFILRLLLAPLRLPGWESLLCRMVVSTVVDNDPSSVCLCPELLAH